MPYFGGSDSQYECPICGRPISNRGFASASHDRAHERREERTREDWERNQALKNAVRSTSLDF